MNERKGSEVGSVFLELLRRKDFEEGKSWYRKSYKSQEIILREGDYTGKVYLVMEGTLRILGSVAMGENYMVRPGVRDLYPNEVFGELSMLDHAPHSATVVAVSDCVIAEIDCRHLHAFLENDCSLSARFYRELAEELVDRLRKTDKQLFAMLAWGLKAHGYDKYMKPNA